jgi:hypothetical protein
MPGDRIDGSPWHLFKFLLATLSDIKAVVMTHIAKGVIFFEGGTVVYDLVVGNPASVRELTSI